jgi:DNA-directed RNA polymerase subunit RPC12/RpoP
VKHKKCSYRCIECGKSTKAAEDMKECPKCGSCRIDRISPPEWRTIKSIDDFPPVGTVCIVWFSFFDSNPCVMVYEGNDLFTDSSGFLTGDIRHWMPLSDSQGERLKELGEVNAGPYRPEIIKNGKFQ